VFEGFHSSNTSGIDVVDDTKLRSANSVSVHDSSTDSIPNRRQSSASNDVLPPPRVPQQLRMGKCPSRRCSIGLKGVPKNHPSIVPMTPTSCSDQIRR
jgi:hypothetical protein